MKTYIHSATSQESRVKFLNVVRHENEDSFTFYHVFCHHYATASSVTESKDFPENFASQPLHTTHSKVLVNLQQFSILAKWLKRRRKMIFLMILMNDQGFKSLERERDELAIESTERKEQIKKLMMKIEGLCSNGDEIREKDEGKGGGVEGACESKAVEDLVEELGVTKQSSGVNAAWSMAIMKGEIGWGGGIKC
ncbi:uncharacterized protein DS421_2g40570 [Arachis hypogaea]|nr:uncharacterized protein DS421_2g40570 [Arachis hypogaea]